MIVLPDTPGSQLLGAPRDSLTASFSSICSWMVSVFWALCLALFPHHTSFNGQSHCSRGFSLPFILRTQISSQPRCLPLLCSAPRSNPASCCHWDIPRTNPEGPYRPQHHPFLCSSSYLFHYHWVVLQPEPRMLDTGKAVTRLWMNHLRTGPTASRGSKPVSLHFACLLG